jgi:hypothetical protein
MTQQKNDEPSWTEPWSADDISRELSRGLAGYLHAVAEELGVPPEGTTFEISDTATAYLALARRWPARPGRDVMLVWSERTGWTVSVETDPDETPMVVARLGGADPVPEPRTVAQFVTEALTGQETGAGPATTIKTNRASLAEGLTRYAVPT